MFGKLLKNFEQFIHVFILPKKGLILNSNDLTEQDENVIGLHEVLCLTLRFHKN